MQVPLCYVVFTWLVPIEISRQEDALTLAACLWLDDKRLGLAEIELLFEGFYVSWEQPGLGEKVEVFWEVLLHGCQIFGEQVLPGQRIHAWEVICPLVGVRFDEERGHRGPIDKPDVPVFLLLDTGAHVEGCSHLVNDLVLRVGDVDHHRWVLEVVLFQLFAGRRRFLCSCGGFLAQNVNRVLLAFTAQIPLLQSHLLCD